MAETSGLVQALRETLTSRGVLGRVEAQVRAEAFSALADESERPPKLSNENLLINELILQCASPPHQPRTTQRTRRAGTWSTTTTSTPLRCSAQRCGTRGGDGGG